jgi:hypothetical protein
LICSIEPATPEAVEHLAAAVALERGTARAEAR